MILHKLISAGCSMCKLTVHNDNSHAITELLVKITLPDFAWVTGSVDDVSHYVKKRPLPYGSDTMLLGLGAAAINPIYVPPNPSGVMKNRDSNVLEVVPLSV